MLGKPRRRQASEQHPCSLPATLAQLCWPSPRSARAYRAQSFTARSVSTTLCSCLLSCQLTTTSGLQRAFHDLTVLPSGKAAIQQGPPGRSANTGHVATVFGCTSFLGRYLVSKLGTCPSVMFGLGCWTRWERDVDDWWAVK